MNTRDIYERTGEDFESVKTRLVSEDFVGRLVEKFAEDGTFFELAAAVISSVVKDSEWSLLRNYYETPYFFASRALRETTYMTIELEKVYRQNDTFFLSLLNKIRENKADDEVLNELNRRYRQVSRRFSASRASRVAFKVSRRLS